MSRGIAAGESARQPAKRLGRSPSTVSREISRTGGRNRYRAATADAIACDRGRRPKQAELAQRPALRAWWRRGWSCAGRLSRSQDGCGGRFLVTPGRTPMSVDSERRGVTRGALFGTVTRHVIP
nr:helix-turn-helix domain-containing protein [Streptomyces rubrogriseus]